MVARGSLGKYKVRRGLGQITCTIIYTPTYLESDLTCGPALVIIFLVVAVCLSPFFFITSREMTAR